MPIYGDDTTTPEDDGMNAGESFILKIWDSSTGDILEYPESFDCWYNNNGAPMAGCGDVNTEYDFGEEVPPPGEPDFAVTMNVSGEGVAYDLTWGMSPDATDGYDDGIDTYAPPAPPPPAFDAALGWMGDRYFTQIIASSMNAVSMNVLLQYPENNNITLTWDNTGWDVIMESALLQDAFGGALGIDINMTTEASLTLTDPAFNTLKLKVTPNGTDGPFLSTGEN